MFWNEFIQEYPRENFIEEIKIIRKCLIHVIALEGQSNRVTQNQKGHKTIK